MKDSSQIRIPLSLCFISIVSSSPVVHDLPEEWPITFVGGGSTANENEFPWQVSLRSTLENFHFCGGVIIDQKTVLTTGACAELVEPYMSTVIAGNVNLTCANNSCPLNQQSRRITSVHIHPNYAKLSDYSNDIAVLKITPAFTVTQSVGPVDLYMSEDSESLSTGTISGWGSKRESEITLQDELQKSTVRLIHSNEECQALIDDTAVSQLIENSMICIDSSGTSRADSCTGDQGGPLVVYSEVGHPYLFGLISFGNGCGRPNMPSFCTRMFPHIDFISLYQESSE